MNRSLAYSATASLLLACGCAYHGAVYSEYSQFALDIRTTAESSAPVKVDLGYDRGVAAFVPKLKGKEGEACSIISWQNIGSTIVPSQLGTNKVLTVDAAVISGTAANVAAAPASAKVIIVPGPEAAGDKLELTTSGGPGARIAVALAPTTFGQDVNTTKIRAWLKRDPAHKKDLRAWMDTNKLQDIGISNLLDGENYSAKRKDIVDHFQIP